MYLFFFLILWVSEMALCVRARAAKAESSQDLRVEGEDDRRRLLSDSSCSLSTHKVQTSLLTVVLHR